MEAPKIVLPGEVISFQVVRLAAHVAGQLEGLKSLTTKFSQASRSFFELSALNFTDEAFYKQFYPLSPHLPIFL